MEKAKRRGAGKPLFLVLAALTAAGALLAYKDFPNAVSCVFPSFPLANALRVQRFLPCSSVEQTIVSRSSLVEQAADIPGWSFFSPEKNRGALRVRVVKDRDRLIFYPRVSGAESSVTVYEVLGNWKKIIFQLRGEPDTWTPVSAMFPLCFECVENGWANAMQPVEFEVRLEGKWAQLWHKESSVFF